MEVGNIYLTKKGKLQQKYLPAVYFDTSVVIDYWLTEGMEINNDEVSEIIKSGENSYLKLIRDILHSDNRIIKVAEIRKKIFHDYENLKTTPVISPITFLELMEWYAESGFKQLASEAVGTIFVQKMGKKQLGDYLKKLLKMRDSEVKEQKKKKSSTTDLEILMQSTWLPGSFAAGHGLSGLLAVDIITFNMPVIKAWDEPFAYAYLQLGVADIIHILLAQHLGCQYLASFDNDFGRVEDIVKEVTGIIILKTPEDILKIL